jgi:hypothetical protein
VPARQRQRQRICRTSTSWIQEQPTTNDINMLRRPCAGRAAEERRMQRLAVARQRNLAGTPVKDNMLLIRNDDICREKGGRRSETCNLQVHPVRRVEVGTARKPFRCKSHPA